MKLARFDHRQRDAQLIAGRGFLLGLLASALVAGPVRGDEAAIVKALKEKGAEATVTKGAVTALTLPDGSKLTDAEFAQIGQLTHLKNLSLSRCLNDKTLGQLTGLAELESLQTNVMDVSDEGFQQLAKLTKLRNVALFHPGKSFTGTGLAALAGLPNLERLTVAGSPTFGDQGMAAVAKLTQLKSFRTWHAGQTPEGMKHLKELKNLKTLVLGQRLTYKPPPCLSDETIAILAEMKSLESLQLDEARLTLTALRQLKQLPELKTLTLAGIDISEADSETLRKELPKVAYKWTKPNEAYLKRIRSLFGGG